MQVSYLLILIDFVLRYDRILLKSTNELEEFVQRWPTEELSSSLLGRYVYFLW